jgi:hypothetical protein
MERNADEFRRERISQGKKCDVTRIGRKKKCDVKRGNHRKTKMMDENVTHKAETTTNIKALFFCWVTSYILVCYYISKLFFHLVPWARPFSRFPLSFSLFLILDLILKKWLTKQTRTKERKIGNVVFQNFSPFIFVGHREGNIKWLTGGPSFWFSFWFLVISLLEMKYWNAQKLRSEVSSCYAPVPTDINEPRQMGCLKLFGQQLTYRLIFSFLHVYWPLNCIKIHGSFDLRRWQSIIFMTLSFFSSK